MVQLSGEFAGRERDYYRECARLVASLAWEDVARIGGKELAAHGRRTQEAFLRLMNDAPPDNPTAVLVQVTRRTFFELAIHP